MQRCLHAVLVHMALMTMHSSVVSSNQGEEEQHTCLLARFHGFDLLKAGVVGVKGVTEAPQHLPVITAQAQQCSQARRCSIQQSRLQQNVFC